MRLPPITLHLVVMNQSLVGIGIPRMMMTVGKKFVQPAAEIVKTMIPVARTAIEASFVEIDSSPVVVVEVMFATWPAEIDPLSVT
jgi:hypothetical protein